MNYPEEAIGVTRAAQAAGIPAAISFTVEVDGKLPTGRLCVLGGCCGTDHRHVEAVAKACLPLFSKD